MPEPVAGRSWFIESRPIQLPEYLNNGLRFVDHYIDKEPFAIWPADTADYDDLPLGNYLIFFTRENELIAEYYCRSNLRIFPLNNQYRVQLEVRDDFGLILPNARLWVNSAELNFEKGIRGFQLKPPKNRDIFLKIAVPGDTLFTEMTAMEQLDRSGWQQWWDNFNSRKTVHIVSWPLRKLRRMFQVPASQWFTKIYRRKSGGRGYIIYNKPKFLPGDSLQFKAYILNKKGKQYKKGLNIFLEYSMHGIRLEKDMGTVVPSPPGSFIYGFRLGDSLATDKEYTLKFKKRKGGVVFRGNFKIEDYLLDEITAYELRSVSEVYFRADTLVFFARALDANGLTLMDGRVKLHLLTKDINRLYKDRDYIPDTLWRGEKSLSVDQDTRFEIPAAVLPDADLSMYAVAEFSNSNNEVQERGSRLIFTGPAWQYALSRRKDILWPNTWKMGGPYRAKAGYRMMMKPGAGE